MDCGKTALIGFLPPRPALDVVGELIAPSLWHNVKFEPYAAALKASAGGLETRDSRSDTLKERQP
jgi:hypothetical protein